ncbi:MAG: hypothetical protein OEY23_20255 [Acidimicrobiia bacterium]|nr:hypothetical protein [Acidimicrobiia bacterium]
MTTHLTTVLSELRTRLGAESYLSQSRWMDELLDLQALAPQGGIRLAVQGCLRRCRGRRLFDTPELIDELTRIEAAVLIESAFEHLVIAA